jgi:RNA polymerase sigma-70 factor (ECF subfamily)
MKFAAVATRHLVPYGVGTRATGAAARADETPRRAGLAHGATTAAHCGTVVEKPARMDAHEPIDRMSEASDEDLVLQLQSGEADGPMTALEARYGRRIFHFVQGMVRDEHLAQDVTQEVFEKVLQKHGLYRPGTNFRAWLFEIARNQALSAVRSRQRLPRPISSLQPGESGDVADLLDTLTAPGETRLLEENEFMAAFQAAVDDLPPHYRTVFDLCVRRGVPYQDAGQELGLPTGTVAIRIMRARKRLFAALQHHLGRLRRPPACFQ